VRQHLLDLNEIQQIDLGIREIERRLESVPVHLKELETETVSLREEIKKLSEQREVIVKEVKTLEGQIQAETIKLKKWEARLIEIRNQREYLALSREVEGSKRQNRDMEEKINELSTQREALDKQLDTLQDKLAEGEVDAQGERQKVEKELAGINDEIAKERGRRQQLLSKVPQSLLRKYEAVRQKRAGVGLVAVIDGSCNGCNMKLPPQLYNILQRVESIEQCPSCQRIIYWSRILPEGAQPAKEGAPASP
jgi:uncharacterized protein